MSEVTMKSTKQQIFDAYQEALKKSQEMDALKESPADKVEKARKEAVVANADKAVDSNIFNEEITKQYEDLKEAIAMKKAELKDLYDIEAQAASLAAIINASKEKKYQLDEEYKDIKAFQEEERKKAVEEKVQELEELQASIETVKEQIQAVRREEISKVNKERKREEEEYAYNLKRERKKENDAWEDEKAAREKEIAIKEANAEAMLAEAESKVEELQTLKAKVDQIPTLIAEAETRGQEAGEKAAGKEYGYQKAMYEKEKDYEISKLQDQVDRLKEAKEDAETKAWQLQEKLDEAYAKMNALASDTVKANGAVKIVSSGSTPSSK